MMFITEEAFTPDFYQPWSKGINHRFAHEIAHQYWGHLIKWASPEEQWFSESFAEISAAYAVRGIRGKTGFAELFGSWQTNAEEAGDRTSIAMANRLPFTSNRGIGGRTNLLYNKGPLLLMKLREEMGGQEFAQFLNAYVKAMRWRFANTEHFVTLLGQATGEDHSELFEKYFWGVDMPKVELPED